MTIFLEREIERLLLVCKLFPLLGEGRRCNNCSIHVVYVQAYLPPLPLPGDLPVGAAQPADNWKIKKGSCAVTQSVSPALFCVRFERFSRLTTGLRADKENRLIF